MGVFGSMSPPKPYRPPLPGGYSNPAATALSSVGAPVPDALGGSLDRSINAVNSLGGPKQRTTSVRKPPTAAPPTPAAGSNWQGGTGQRPSPYGSESGPGILEQWFNQRANGTDPGYEYAMDRGMQGIGNRMASAGSFNSGATAQQQSDFAANMAAQREGQLDALAGGASGEHQGRLNAMLNQMMGLAGGQSGTMGAYDTASANAMSQGLQALIQMMGGKAGVDQKSNQQLFNNLATLAPFALAI